MKDSTILRDEILKDLRISELMQKIQAALGARTFSQSLRLGNGCDLPTS